MTNRGRSWEELADILREDILKGTIRSGAKLTEQIISERFEVSRTPVREALGKLESEGLIDTIPNCGAFAVGLSAEDATDMIEMRKLYESIAARKAAAKATKANIEVLEERYEFMKHYTDKGDLRKMKEINRSFHAAIYEIADSRLLSVAASRVNTYLKFSMHTKDYRREHLGDIFGEHERVYQAIIKKDPEAASAAMALHINNMAVRALKKG